MSTGGRGPRPRRVLGVPVLLVVGADPRDVETTARALDHRFAPDYRVLTAGSAAAALIELERAARRGEQVALVAADLRLPDGDGVEFLQRAAGLHRGVARVLLFDMDEHHTHVPFSELPALQRASALGQIDVLDGQGLGEPRGMAVPPGAGSPQRLVPGTPPGPRRLPHHRRSVGTPLPRPARRPHGQRRALRAAPTRQRHRPAADQGPPGGRGTAAGGIRHDGTVLQDPSIAELAASHGIQIRPTASAYDLVVLGAGPAGLAAAVYGASEGLRTLLVEARSIGGQAGTSSMIRNYLGFPGGISGGELAHRAWQQAILLGAEFVYTHRVTGLTSDGARPAFTLDDGSRLTASAVILAAGVSYRRLDVPDLDRLVGAGVFYGAAGVRRRPSPVRTSTSSAAPTPLGRRRSTWPSTPARVTLLVRGGSLAAGMSDYLVRQIGATSNVDVRLHTEVVGGRGRGRLEGLTLQDRETQRQQDVPAAAVFIMIGARPRTGWLAPVLSLDEKGFIRTGRDVPPADWPLDRDPYPFETSRPGVFAAGDVRQGSVKRVAGAVGEGSVAVGSVHRYLAELAAAPEPLRGQAVENPTSG